MKTNTIPCINLLEYWTTLPNCCPFFSGPSYKFHLLPSISCTGDELQPFPEDWYQHGYIESQQPVRADYVEYDEGSYDDGQRSDEGWVPRWEDDRMGMMEHPIRGTQ